MPEQKNSKMSCDTLMVAVVQAQDAEVTENRLGGEATSVTRLPSLGAFLGRQRDINDRLSRWVKG